MVKLTLIIAFCFLTSLLCHGQTIKTPYQVSLGSGYAIHTYLTREDDSSAPPPEYGDFKAGIPVDLAITTFISPRTAFSFRQMLFHAFAQTNAPAGVTLFDAMHFAVGYKYIFYARAPVSFDINESLYESASMYQLWTSVEVGYGKIELRSFKDDVKVSDTLLVSGVLGVDLSPTIFPAFSALQFTFAPNFRPHIFTQTTIISFLLGTYFSDLF